MHPTSRIFYVFILIASLCSTAIYISLLTPAWPLSDIHLPFTSSNSKPIQERFAYATFLGPPTTNPNHDNSTDDEDILSNPYFISVRLLNYQILYADKTKTMLDGVPFLILVLPQVPRSWTEALKKEGATIVLIEPLDLPDVYDKDFINNSRFRDVLSKLRLWTLTDWDKILYLDADSFLLQDLDGLFTDPDLSTTIRTLPRNATEIGGRGINMPDTYLMAASADTYGDQTGWEEPGHINYLCACFMLISPSLTLFEYYLSVLSGPDAPPNAVYPEQDLLIYVHRPEGRMPWRRIPIEWSANDGEMNDELALMGGVKSLHVKGWEGAEGGNVGSEKYMGIWRGLVKEMVRYYEEAKRWKEG